VRAVGDSRAEVKLPPGDSRDSVKQSVGRRMAAILALRPSALVLDFGGTIAETQVPGELPRLLPGVAETLGRLAPAVHRLAILGSRPSIEMAASVGIRAALYVGRQGLDRVREGAAEERPLEPRVLDAFAQACTTMRPYLRVIDGVVMDLQPRGMTIHYGGAPLPRWTRGQILRVLQPLSELDVVVQEGRRLIEVWPPGTPGKAAVVADLVQREGLRGLVYCGDDRRDIETFRALTRLRGIRELACLSVAVLGSDDVPDVPEAADVSVASSSELVRALASAAELLGQTNR
jgi:trehalose-phosphatase